MTTQETFLQREHEYLQKRDVTLNPEARRQLEAHRPPLNEVQRRIISDLEADGIALVHFEELFGGRVPWDEISTSMDEFSGSENVRDRTKAYRESFGSVKSKEYIIRAYEKGIELPADNCWLKLGLRPELLDTVNAFLGLWSKLSYVDLWYTPPVADERDAIASQQWHRDPEDEKLVKIFLYCNDVSETSGPFQYLDGSFQGGRYQDVWPLPRAALLNVKGAPEIAQNHSERKDPPGLDRIPPHEHRVCTGRAGTFVFCNTSGIHRGGFATENPRILAHWVYNSPASPWPRRFSSALPSDSSDAAKFAVE